MSTKSQANEIDKTGRVDLFVKSMGERILGNRQDWPTIKPVFDLGIQHIPSTPLPNQHVELIRCGMEFIERLQDVLKSKSNTTK